MIKMMSTGFGIGGLGMGLGLVFWAAVLLALYYLLADRNKIPQSETDPMDILKRRYANGSITREEYHRMKQEL